MKWARSAILVPTLCVGTHLRPLCGPVHDMKDRKWIIEPRIRPLVDAINDMGLAVTFSSCEGHFGEDLPVGFNDREMADVCFELKEGTSEAELEKLFGHVIGRHVNSSLMWKATLRVHKEYVPGDKSDYIPGHVFVFLIRPFDPDVSARTKRKNVDLVIKQTVDSIKEYMGKRQGCPAHIVRFTAPAAEGRHGNK